jgi:hypothetical protein
VFKQHHELLKNLGSGDLTQPPCLTEDTVSDAEQFVCQLYGVHDANSVDKARAVLFMKSHTPETLPPTRDVLMFHLKRPHNQATLCRQAHLNYPVLPSPQSMGWKNEDGKLAPVGSINKNNLIFAYYVIL